MDIEFFKKVNSFVNRKNELEHEIKRIERDSLKFARKIELSNYPRYNGYCQKMDICLDKEQSEKVGNLIKQILEEELQEVNKFLDSVEIYSKWN